jgi:hypothetical protein
VLSSTHIFVYRTLNTHKKAKYNHFLREVRRYWISEVQNQMNPILKTFNCQRSKQHQGGLNRTRQADSSVISEYTNLEKRLVVGREKRNILQDSVNCVAHKERCENRYICKFCTVPLHKGSCFEKCHSVMSC